MDADKDMDIVVASFTDDTVRWFENNGAADPTWSASNIATSIDGARDVEVLDIDKDGDLMLFLPPKMPILCIII